MSKRLLQTTIAFLFIIIAGCYSFKSNLSRDAAVADIINVNYDDGINYDEALIIAKNYLLTTQDEPCRSLANKYNIGDPVYTNTIYKNDYDVIRFDKLGFNIIGNAPLYVNVNYKTGEAVCGGTKAQK